MSQVVWTPDAVRAARSQMVGFRRYTEERIGVAVADSAALHAWSVSDPALFWSLLWDFTDVIGHKGARDAVDLADMRSAKFFPDGRLNFAENLLRRRDDAIALLECDESGLRRCVSYHALADQVLRAAAVLADWGVRSGDRVAAYLPNGVGAVVWMLATASQGAIWSSCSPDFGLQGVLDRFGQIAPKVLIGVDGYVYKRKRCERLDAVEALSRRLPSLEHVIIEPYLDPQRSSSGVDGARLTSELLEGASPRTGPFEKFPFNHPLYILYSSGTTGRPKCIVHAAGGTLLQHLKEHRLHCDVRPDDRFFYFTTLGWMMWNWLVSGLASGAALVLYDGFPRPNVIFDLVDREGIHVFGTSAKFIDAIKKRGLTPRSTHQLSHLRTVLSTGSPLLPESFDYVHQAIKEDVHVASISGGTDIVSCFVLGDPTRPVRRGEIQGAGLGMDVQVWNEQGYRVYGEMGELVCATAFPSMPIAFWGDDDGVRYQRAYFERFPGVWCHGDFTMETDAGGFVIAGRSDATLNPGGVRIGTAEIYRQVEQLPQITESLAVGLADGGDERIVLFVVLAEGHELDQRLCDGIKCVIRTGASPRHVPASIMQAPELPRTRSGKLSELSVKRVLLAQNPGNLEALANPECLAFFKALAGMRVMDAGR